MQQTIKQLLASKPKHAIRMIANNPELWQWVEQNCDPCCIDNATKIYTAISGEKILCPCGSGKLRTLASIKEGLRFCAKANSCSAANQSVSEKCQVASRRWDKLAAKQKRKQTNLEKYGVENTGQIELAKQNHRMLYSDRSRVEKIVERMQRTCSSRWGTPNIRQQHITSEALGILQNREEFAKQLRALGREQLAKKLGVWGSTISQYHIRYDLDIISPHFSQYEVAIGKWLNENNIAYRRDRTICKPLEIDFYIPDYNLAIEFDGLYWHSETAGKGRHYHRSKTESCRQKNIELVHIFEDEWKQRPDVCKSVILGKLNKITNVIAARKCKIRRLTNAELRPFLDQHHLQGYCMGQVNLALEYQGETVMVMTFSKSRYNRNVDWELVRLATKCYTHIIGGSKKLWAYFVANFQPLSVVSYCDRRWFTGEVYRGLGFQLTRAGRPMYNYTDCTRRFHRTHFTKKNAINKVLQQTNEYSRQDLQKLTENYITKNILGLHRIWDCGQDTWIWKKA